MGDAIVWWISLQLMGLAAIPIAAVLLRALPDRGFTLSKPLGLLLAGWLAYMLAMLKILQFDRLSVSLCVVVVAAFSFFLLVRNGRALLYDLTDHFSSRGQVKYVLVAEAIFTLAFIIWAIVRAYNPDIMDQEKFMDYGFLNAILKSGTFPPNDPWLAGFSINYYYFGYILMAALTAFSGVETQVAFNLANVALFALTALGSFGIVHNLITSRLLVRAARAGRRGADEGRTTNDERPRYEARNARRETRDVRMGEERRPGPGPEARPGERRASGRRPVDEEPARPEERRTRTGSGSRGRTVEPGRPVRTSSASLAAPAANALPSRKVKAKSAEATVVVDPEAVVTEDVTADGQTEEAEEMAPVARREAIREEARHDDSPAYLPVTEAAHAPRRVPFLASPYLYAVIAALMVVAMGNLTTMFAVHDGDTIEGNGFRFCFACNNAAGYNWFGASRVIQDYVTTGNPPQKQKVGFETINEFPAFSFVLADLHPHVMALPFVLLALGVAFALAKRRVIRGGDWGDGLPPGLNAWASIVLVGLIIGSLYTINTWDVPTYGLLALLCLAVPYVAAARRQDLGWRWLRPYIVQVILIGLFAVVTFLPFHLTFKSLVGGANVQVPENLANIPLVGWILERLGALVLVNNADKTILGFVVIFGIFLVALLVWLGFEFYSFMKRKAQTEDGVGRGPYIWGGFLVLTLLAAILFRFPLLALLLPMVAVAFGMVWREPRRTERNVVLIMVGVAALIGLVIEVVYLRDNFQMRMNTLFKFYFQIWILWALAAGYGFWRVMYAAFGTSREPAPRRDRYADRYANRYAGPPSGGAAGIKALTGTWAVLFMLLVLSGLMYSWYAVQTRQVGGKSAMVGLDGTIWMAKGQLAGDLAVANWLKQNATGNDVVLESGAAEYDWTGRISSFSGVPTLLASDNSHERLWRTNQADATQQISGRRTVVNSIYQGIDPSGGTLTADRLLALLKEYNVDYVVVGPIERGVRENPSNNLPGENITPYAEDLFKYALPVAFNGGDSVLYKVPEAPLANGAEPNTPIPGQTPGASPQPDLNTPPAGLLDMAGPGINRGQFNLPRGITQDSAGNFYVVDTQNMRVQKFDKDGKWLAMFGSKGGDVGQFNPYSDDATGSGPGGVVVDAEGNVYVADTWNHRIQKFDKDGNYLLQWGGFINLADAAAEGAPENDSKFYGPRGIAIGPDGNVYVTDTGNKRVSIFTPGGKFVRQISSGVKSTLAAQLYPYNKEGEMNEPIGIAVDKDGTVYVADTRNKRIQKFDSTGKFAGLWTMPEGMWDLDTTAYMEPYMALDAKGDLYVTAPTGKTVIKFSPAGQVLQQKNSNGTTTLQLPTGITVGADGNVYVVDTTANGVVNLGTMP